MEEGDLRINGKVYDPNTMTFREQREVRRLVREELFDGEMIADDDLKLPDLLPAMATVLVRRDNPTFQLEEALDLVPNDIVVTADDAKTPPTRKTSTRATTGPPK